ncbi:MAG: sulfatase [Candidatus Aminicenantes bacterium]
MEKRNRYSPELRERAVQCVNFRLLNNTLGVGLIIAILIGSFACVKEKSQNNLLLVTLDTQRADHLSCYGSSLVATPNLDYIADQGILFEQCYSPIPITLPAHGSLFFSQPPHEFHCYNNGEKVESDEKRPSLASIFKKNGYATAAFTSLGVLQAKFGLAEGFEHYEGTFPNKGRFYIPAEEVNNLAFPWIEQNQDKPIFLWIHYSDPHSPYYPPYLPPGLKLFFNDEYIGEYHLNKTHYKIDLELKAGNNVIRLEIDNPHLNNPQIHQAVFNRLSLIDLSDKTPLEFSSVDGLNFIEPAEVTQLMREGTIVIDNTLGPRKIRFSFQGKFFLHDKKKREFYQDEVAYLDREFGRLIAKLKELEMFEKTNLVIVGDHGEGLGEYLNEKGNRDFGHINYLYNFYLRVPLIFSGPDVIFQGERSSTPVTLIDVAPSIMTMMGLKQFSHFRGRDVFSLTEDDDYRLLQATYAPQADQTKFAFFTRDWHLILTPAHQKYELYALKEDPLDKHDLYDPENLPAEVNNLVSELNAVAIDILSNKSVNKVSKQTEEMLKALGYIR